MSARRKHVTLGMREEVAALEDGQAVARMVGARGGNIMEVELSSGRRTLAMMPARFNKKLWVRRGGFVVVEECEEAAGDTKVTGTILQVLYDEQIKQLRKIPGAWPAEFDAVPGVSGDAPASTSEAQGGSTKADASGAEQGSAAEVTDALGDLSIGAADRQAAGAGQSSSAGNGGGCSGGGPGGGGAGEGCDAGGEEEEEEEEDDDLPPLFQNTNRKVIYHEVTDSEDEDDD